MSNWEWLYQRNAKRRRQSDMQLRMQIEQQNIQNFLLLNTDTMTYMPTGGVQIFGSYSFGNTDQILKASNEGAFTFGSSDDFCIEWFQKHSEVTHTPRSTIFSINELTSFGVSYEENLLTLWISNGVSPILQVDFEESEYTGEWMHVAILRKDGKIYVYKNGIKVYSIFDSTAQTEDFFPMSIGSSEFDRVNTLFQGLISDFRFVIGNSVYEPETTIEYPTSNLQSVEGTRLLLNALESNPFSDSGPLSKTIIHSSPYDSESPYPFNPTIYIPQYHRVRYDIADLDSYPGSGSIVYDLKDGINSTLFNSPNYTSSGPKYLTFNGVNQYLGTSADLSPYFVGTEKVTISMWLYPMDNGVILSERGQTALASGWHEANIAMVGSTAKFGMWNGASISTITSSIPTPLNNWYNFVLKYDGSNMTAYVNGATAGNLSFNRQTPYNNNRGLYYTIAASDLTSMGDTTYANMRLGLFDIYEIDLEYAEISAEFNSTKSRFGL